MRMMTPDQMNINPGNYLSQDFSQSDGGSRQMGQSSLRSSGDLAGGRMSGTGGSLGYSYGSDASGSMTYSELQRLAGSSNKLQMSLTLPTGQDESDLSEIDITDT